MLVDLHKSSRIYSNKYILVKSATNRAFLEERKPQKMLNICEGVNTKICTVKYFGGSLLLWSCFTAGALLKVDGRNPWMPLPEVKTWL